MAQLQVPTIEPFDCEGDPTSIGSRWERWKRALEIYFIATKTNDQNKKRAMLLHSGGMALQDIYFNVPGACSPMLTQLTFMISRLKSWKSILAQNKVIYSKGTFFG